MTKQKFKPGDKVKFTQEAKGRFDDDEYWHLANYSSLDLDKVYTIRGYANGNWPNYSLKEKNTAPYIADYLLVPAEIEQTEKKNMTKKDFILALVQAIFPDQDLTYFGCKPYAKVHTKADIIIVKCPKNKEGGVNLTLVPVYGNFEETDIELVTKFLEQNCNLDCPEDSIEVTDSGDLFMYFKDYPWHMISEIKPSTREEPCDNCEVVRKLQAEIQRFKYELDQAKAAQSQTKASPQKGEPLMVKFDLPDGRQGIVFGFSF